jgi:uncharacterized lipoprotein
MKHAAKLVLLLLAAAPLSACSTPSELYGLEPPSTDRTSYPNINVPPGLPRTEALSPEQRAAEQAKVAQQGNRPSASAQ